MVGSGTNFTRGLMGMKSFILISLLAIKYNLGKLKDCPKMSIFCPVSKTFKASVCPI